VDMATFMQALGGATISVGLGLIWLPIGIISAGIFITLFGLAWERIRNAE